MAREYKDSGIEWIGQIPKEWDLIRLKFITDINSGEIISKEEYETEGKYPIIGSNGEIGRLNKKNNNNQVVTTGRVGTIGTTHLVKDAWITDNALIIYPNNICGHYLYYVVPLFDYKLMLSGTAQPLITSSKLKNQITPFPTLSTQQCIANFLDRKCAEMDELIALQETMIEELKTYKQSVITEAVTKGLNPNVPMKDSGVDWIGEVPEHWKQHQFRRLFEIKKIIAGKLGYDVLSVTQNGIKVKDLSKNEGQIAQDYSKYQIVEVDDYVMNHMDLLTGFVDCSSQVGVTSPDYRVFRAIDKTHISLSYYLKIFQTCYKEKIFYHLGQGVSGMGRWRLPAEQLKLFILPMPPLDEQQAIASYLDSKCSEIDALIAIKQQKIEELKEYKKSIIYEYVTGKKEIA